MEDKKIGMITEQGDLGLGFEELTDEENDKIKKDEKTK